MTTIFIIIIVAAVFIFDVWVIFKKGKQASVSANIIRGSKKYPLVTLMVGMLLGHLYWSMNTADIYPDVECKRVDAE